MHIGHLRMFPSKGSRTSVGAEAHMVATCDKNGAQSPSRRYGTIPPALVTTTLATKAGLLLSPVPEDLTDCRVARPVVQQIWNRERPVAPKSRSDVAHRDHHRAARRALGAVGDLEAAAGIEPAYRDLQSLA